MAQKKKLYNVFLKRYTVNDNNPSGCPWEPLDTEYTFIGKTSAVSKRQAVNNIRFRSNIKTGLIIDHVSWGVFQELYAVEV